MRNRLPAGERGIVVIDIGPTTIGSLRLHVALNRLDVDIALHAHLAQSIMENLEIGIDAPAFRGTCENGEQANG